MCVREHEMIGEGEISTHWIWGREAARQLCYGGGNYGLEWWRWCRNDYSWGAGGNLKNFSFNFSSSNYQVSVEKNTLWST